jgi:flagellar export protein FliJ
MARFRFALERLLQLRRQQAQQARLLLSALTQQRLHMEERAEQLQHQHDGAHEAAVRPGMLSAQELHDVWAYCRYLQMELEQNHHRWQQLRELETAQLLHVQETRRAEEILQRLRERRWEAFRVEETRAEQQQTDEVAQRHRHDPWHTASP